MPWVRTVCEDAVCGCFLGITKGVFGVSLYTAEEAEEIAFNGLITILDILDTVNSNSNETNMIPYPYPDYQKNNLKYSQKFMSVLALFGFQIINDNTNNTKHLKLHCHQL